MEKDVVIKSLQDGICKVVFTKVNGDNRIMHCTLSEELLPPQKDIEEEITKKKKPNDAVLAVYDVDQKGWRSFRWDSLKEISTEYNL
jgi:hypothetical protein